MLYGQRGIGLFSSSWLFYTNDMHIPPPLQDKIPNTPLVGWFNCRLVAKINIDRSLDNMSILNVSITILCTSGKPIWIWDDRDSNKHCLEFSGVYTRLRCMLSGWLNCRWSSVRSPAYRGPTTEDVTTIVGRTFAYPFYRWRHRRPSSTKVEPAYTSTVWGLIFCGWRLKAKNKNSTKFVRRYHLHYLKKKKKKPSVKYL